MYSCLITCRVHMLFSTSQLARQLAHRKERLLLQKHFFCSTRSLGKEPATSEGQPRRLIDIEGPDHELGELGPLTRPLGVRERPTTLVKSRTQRLKEMLDSEKVMEQRRHLYVVYLVNLDPIFRCDCVTESRKPAKAIFMT